LLIKKKNHIIANIILTNFNKMKTKKIPPIIQIAAWLLSLIVFAVGFWHTHLGMKEMRPFGSENGSIAIAAIILILLLITYWFAVNGRKMALVFYIICGLFFFVFNLNYFYPAYMARQLVKEEAIAMNDTLQKFTGMSTKGVSQGSVPTLQKLFNLKDKVLFEIRKDGGLGPDAKGYLAEINQLTKDPIKLNGALGNTQSKRENIASEYAKLIDRSINYYTLNNIKKVSGEANSGLVLEGMQQLTAAQQKYTEPLKKIIENDREIPLEALIKLRQKGSNHPEIILLSNLRTDIDNATKKINEGNKKNIFPVLGEAETRNLGRIKHTLYSVKKRIKETDTLGIILICLFVDLLVPLAIYLLLKKDDEEEESTRLRGKNIPTQF
jgi:hypothetical protein